jgi:hypothetical protein
VLNLNINEEINHQLIFEFFQEYLEMIVVYINKNQEILIHDQSNFQLILIHRHVLEMYKLLPKIYEQMVLNDMIPKHNLHLRLYVIEYHV